MNTLDLAPISAIPSDDIKDFIIEYGYDVPDSKNEKYNLLSKIISNNTINEAPTSIVDYIIAAKLIDDEIIINKKLASEIIMTNEKDLTELSNILLLPYVNKERILRILGYINKLDNDLSLFDKLPDETIVQIIKNFDCKSIFDICELSNRFSNFCKTDNRLDFLLKNKFIEEGLSVEDYTLPELEFICNMRSRKISSMTSIGDLLFILLDNDIYLINLVDDERKKVLIHKLIIIDLPKIIQILYHKDRLLALGFNGNIYIIGGDIKLMDGIAMYNNKVEGVNNVLYMVPRTNFHVIGADGKVYNLVIRNNMAYTSELYYLKNVTDESDNLVLKTNSQIYLNNNRKLTKIDIDNVKIISSGFNHYLASTLNGSVYGWGNNNYGQLGLGDQNDREEPVLISGVNNVIDVLANKQLSLILDNKGKVYKFGRGFDDMKLNPTKILDNVVEIYQTNNYKEYVNEDYDIMEDYEIDRETFNFQIAKTVKNEYIVLIAGEYFYAFSL